MISPELDRFCTEWLAKAAQYNNESIASCYDKFFTLFVVFNRLYAEATFALARRGEIKLAPNRPLPDRKGATEYTLAFIGQERFQRLYGDKLVPYVNDIARMIEDAEFYIKLSAPNGDRQRDKDLVLLEHLRSTGKTQALATLDVLYSIRCNLFHGHKSFHPVQVRILTPTIGILSDIIDLLRMVHNENMA